MITRNKYIYNLRSDNDYSVAEKRVKRPDIPKIKADNNNLKSLVMSEILRLGPKADLNHIDVSECTFFANLFENTMFVNIDISKWDVSSATNMSFMFAGSSFNGDISDWDVSKVENMAYMFHQSKFNGDISKWNVSNVRHTAWMFAGSEFNGDISAWDVSNIDNMNFMFANSKFSGDISSWVPFRVRTMNFAFSDSNITEKDIYKWIYYYRPSNTGLFFNAKKTETSFTHFIETTKTEMTKQRTLWQRILRIYPQAVGTLPIIKAYDNTIKDIVKFEIKKYGNKADLNHIDVSEVTNMYELFTHEKTRFFNGDISAWDVSNVTNMRAMFACSKFNGDISRWNVSKVYDMYQMFDCSSFNGDISKWDVSNVTNMEEMFASSKFNGDISAWDISNVKYADYMFYNSYFNQDISAWDVSNIKEMGYMFAMSKFNSDISSWRISKNTRTVGIFNLSSYCKGYPNTSKDIPVIINEASRKDCEKYKNFMSEDVARLQRQRQHQLDFLSDLERCAKELLPGSGDK